jgi:hypothetical protein
MKWLLPLLAARWLDLAAAWPLWRGSTSISQDSSACGRPSCCGDSVTRELMPSRSIGRRSCWPASAWNGARRDEVASRSAA